MLTAFATLALIAIGGLVTSHGAGLSVPDWPNSYGYNMFLFPPSKWVGGILYEHTHRLWASMVGVLVVVLTRWLGGRAARRPLAIVGLAELLAGIGIFLVWPNLKATGGFLTGIGGIVLLAALVWARNEPSPRPLPLLGWLAFGLVQVQGLLGGLRVVLIDDELGIFHAALAQLFFLLLCAIALCTSRWWIDGSRQYRTAGELTSPDSAFKNTGAFGVERSLRRLFLFTTGLIFLQLVIGATMRHQHAGLAIPDFPLAYGRLWPATDAASVQLYNQLRMEAIAVNPITAFQIDLQMVHRIVALLILVSVGLCAWRARKIRVHSRTRSHDSSGTTLSGADAFREATRRSVARIANVWLGLILLQVALGAWTIWSNKAADVATAHVLVGALSLATGGLLCIISSRNPESACSAPALSDATAFAYSDGPATAKPAPAQ